MKVAIIHEWLTNVAGSERVLLELKKLYPEAPIFTSVFDPKEAHPFAQFDVRTSYLQRLPIVKAKREALIPLTPLAFEQFDLSEYDLVISSSHMAAKGVITKPDTVHISYCHTPPRYLWEPDVDPRAAKGKLAWLRRRVTHNMRIWDRVAADRVDHYFANSHYVARRIKKYYGRDSVVIHPPVGVDRFEIAKKEDIGNYYLFVSRLIDYKKCDLVVDAFNTLGLPLKVIGTGPDKPRLEKKAKSNIEFLGRLSDAEAKDYYAKAYTFIFPAEDDFGIVPVEAMAAGRPVIAYNAGGATETVIEGKTGTFFNEQTPQCLIETIQNFNAEKYDSEKVRQHALTFSADRFRKEFKIEVDRLLKQN